MGFDLFTTVRNANPINPYLDIEGFIRNEIELRNYIRFNFFEWRMLLSLARSYGWKPLGALFREDNDINSLSVERSFSRKSLGALSRKHNRVWITTPSFDPDKLMDSYLFNEGQVVKTVDAFALANALEKALNDISDHDTSAPRLIEVLTSEEAQDVYTRTGFPLIKQLLANEIFDGSTPLTIPNVYLAPQEFFSGSCKQDVVNFIDFCRKGAFEIW